MTCVRRGRSCRYVAFSSETRVEALKREHNSLRSQKGLYQQLVEVLQSVPEEDASNILKRLRSGMNIEMLLNHVTTSNLLLQLAVGPESRFRYDFPYHKEVPASLLTNDNAYFKSPFYEPEALFPPATRYNMPRYSYTLPASGSLSDQNGAAKELIYLRPFHAAKVVETRLHNADIASWTTVCGDNVLLRNILLRWLQCEFHFTAAFQLNLFIEDMVAFREDFCSSLLVNVVLGYACVCTFEPFHRLQI